MDINSKEFKFVQELPECWLYRNGEYKHLKGVKRLKKLPSIPEKYEIILKRLGLGYQKCLSKAHCLEYWDKDNFEEKNLTLVLYAYFNEKYVQMGYHTQKVITLESILAAEQKIEIVKEAIAEFESGLSEIQLIDFMTKNLNGKAAVVVQMKYSEKEDYITEDIRYKVFPVMHKIDKQNKGEDVFVYSSGYCVIIDVNKIESDLILEITVPTGQTGLVVGVKGWQVRGWVQKLGLKRINVVES